MTGTFKLISKNCVNSLWPAYWFRKEGLETCQCGFECKVKVSIEKNGHKPYTYIVTKKEYNRLHKELTFIKTLLNKP